MRLSVLLCSGRVVATLDADPAWRLQDLLDAVQEQARTKRSRPGDGASEHRRRVFLGHTELRGRVTLEQVGAREGDSLTLVQTPARVVTASTDGTAKVWSASSGECLRTLSGHRCAVLSATFSPGGEEVLTASADSAAVVWSADSGERLRVLQGHEDEVEVFVDSHTLMVERAAFSPSGREVLTTSIDHAAKIWSAASGECLRTLGCGHLVIGAAAFSPDGRSALTTTSEAVVGRGGDHDVIKLWSVATGEHLRTLLGHHGWVNAAAFSPDGHQVLTASDDNTARLWSASSGACLHTLDHEGEVESAAFSPDGRTVLSAGEDGTAKLWSTASGECLATLNGHRDAIQKALFSPDGRTALTASRDCTAKLWSIETGLCLRTLAGHGDAVVSAAFSPDGREVLTASFDHTARLWSTDSGECLRALTGHAGWVVSAAFSPGG